MGPCATRSMKENVVVRGVALLLALQNYFGWRS